MDADKRQVLHDVGYTVRPACGLCTHARIAPATDWGTCKAITYEHQKHSDATRELSIHRSGGCPRFELSDPAAAALGSFREFLA